MIVSVEDIYPLSPAQRGMLFHSVYASGAPLYFHQLTCELEGALDEQAFRRAWADLVERHPALRSSFMWEGLEQPLQVVSRGVTLDVTSDDWRAVSDDEQCRQWAAWLEADRARGFDLGKAPLARVALIRTGGERHRLAWSHHHALLDGWSIPLAFGELMALYDGHRTGVPARLPAARPYRDYIEWLQRRDPDASERFWRDQLRELSRPTYLADAICRGQPAAGDRHDEQELPLDADLGERLQRWAQANQLTENTVVEGAWACLLSRYVGESDVVFGSVVSGRPADLAGVESMLGLFINTLPVRVEARSDAVVADWLRELQQRLAEIREHQDTPLVDIQRWSPAAGGRPLFDTIVVFENYPWNRALSDATSGIAIRRPRGFSRSNYGLTLMIPPGRDRSIRMIYDASAYSRTAVGALLRHFERLLRSIVAAGDRRIGELEMLAGDERERLLAAGTGAAREVPRDRCIHELFERQVEATPDAVAVVCREQRVTYADLNRRANRLAHALRECGVGPEIRVGLYLRRNLDMVAGVIATLKAGGTYVPLDAGSPVGRLAFMLEDARPHVVLTDESLAGSLPERDRPSAILLDRDHHLLATRPAENRGVRALPEMAAYVIYTSGSTGRPKGVVIEHRQILSYLDGVSDRAALATSASFAMLQPLAVDSSATVLYASLCQGGCLHVIAEEMATDPIALASYFERERIDCLKIAPSHLAALLQSGSRAERLLPRKRLIVGGESSRREWLVAVQQMAPNCAVFNHYGPTETTVGVLMHRLNTSAAADGSATVPIGRPLPKVRAYVLDSRGEPVPVGVAGELYIGGPSVGRGYLNRPDLTADRFVPDPFGDAGDRLYRTGDLARWQPDGEIEFLGRRDQQVKIRGYRIELDEIETTLGRQPEVRDCVVEAKGHGPDARRLVAYVVWDLECIRDVQALRQRLQQQLPDYMVPTAWVDLEKLPLTAHGKVDRRALPEPDRDAAGRPEQRSAPRTPTEDILAGIFADVLKTPRVGIDDNFFELGGHSLTAMQVVSRVRQVFRVEMPIRRLFDRPTVAALAESVDEQLRAGNAPPLPPIARAPRERDIPLSFAQQRLFFLQQFEPDSRHYNVSLPLRLIGELETATLERALCEIVRRHEVLRTAFALVDGNPVQVIRDADAFTLTGAGAAGAIDVADADREDTIRRVVQEAMQQPFDLLQGPPLRAALVQFAGDDHLLVLTMHHVVTDGWSMDVLMRELRALYSAFRAGAESPLTDLRVQYADYALWQRACVQGQMLDAELTYWREQLDGVVPLDLPTDRPRAAFPRHRGASEPIVLAPGLIAALEQLSRSAGVTLFMTLVAGFDVLLQRYAGQDDVVVGTPIAGRTREETERLIGCFVNTLPLRVDLAGNPRVGELLARVKRTALGAYAHQQVPFEKLVEELQPERDLSRNPIFQVVFVLQNAPESALTWPGLSVAEVDAGNQAAKFDLTLRLARRASGGLTGEIEYDADLYDAATVRRMAAHWRRLLAAMAEDGERRIGALEMLEEHERAPLLIARGRTDAEPSRTCLHELFEAQAANRPDAVALVCDGRRMSYGELNARANKLAHYLTERGVRPETLVAICAERSIDLIVGLLGIVKAGGAYVPLDPQHPAERLRGMLQDSQSAALITERAFRDRLASYTGVVVELDGDWPVIAQRSDQNPSLAMASEHAAYVIYTSGSTGEPKGCLVTHDNVVALLKSTEESFAFGPRDVWTLFHSAAFDFSVWEMWGTLGYGGRLVIVSYWTSRSPSDFFDLIRREGVTVLNQTPSAFWPFLREDRARGAALPIRLVIFGGESLDFRPLHMWYERHDDRMPVLVNMYGITETTVHVTSRAIHRADVDGGRTHRIGVGIPGVAVYVLDEQLKPVPVGVPGEIYVGGSGVARGYWRRPTLTAERFVADCFCDADGGRMYRSGDRGRWVEHEGAHELEYLGRLDQQVKIRGFRVEVGEIEAALRKQAGVQDAVVLAHAHDDGPRLNAYVVAARDRAAEPSALRQALLRELPTYMVPTGWAILDQLPLNTNGKLDRAALPQATPVQDGESLGDGPRDALERIVWKVWMDVLAGVEIGRDSNFFDLGGHSLAAARVVARADALFHVKLGIRSIFENPTPGSFAAEVRRRLLSSPVVLDQPELANLIARA